MKIKKWLIGLFGSWLVLTAAIGPLKANDNRHLETDYFKVDINPDGSLTFTNKNTGNIILSDSPQFHFNYASQYITNSGDTDCQVSEEGDNISITIVDNNNSYIDVTHRYRLHNHSPYIDYTVTLEYKQEVEVSEERFDFLVPDQDAQVMHRDFKLMPFEVTGSYWSDLYTPKVVKFSNGLQFLGCDTMQSFKVEAFGLDTMVCFYSDYGENHPHKHFIQGGGGDYEYLNETKRYSGDSYSASVQFAVNAGESYPYVVKTRQPYGFDAVLLFTTHPDSWSLDAAKAVAYGTADESSPDYGVKGIVSRGLGWTHGTFIDGQAYALNSHLYPGVEEFIQQMFNDGVEIVPHTFYADTDTREQVESGMQAFREYNSRNWIDHSASSGSNNFEDLASQGAVKGHENYILDLFDLYNYSYAWNYNDLNTYDYTLNMLKPEETNAIRPFFYYNNQVDDYIYDNKRIYLWSAVNTFKKVDLYYTNSSVDTLINQRGVHISHEYFGHSRCENHVYYNNNGSIEILPAFDSQLEYIANKRNNGLVWSPTMAIFADYLVPLKDVSLAYNRDGTMTVTNNSPETVSGLTLLAEQSIQSVIIDHYELISFGGSYGEKELVLPPIAAGDSVVLNITYGAKDTGFPTVACSNTGDNKVNEITAYWSNAEKTVFMTAEARSGTRSFSIMVPIFADKTVTVRDITSSPTVIGTYQASGTGKIQFSSPLASRRTFEITGSTGDSEMKVSIPGSGEGWLIGSTQTINWESTRSIGNVKIEYSTDNGSSWHTISVSTPDDGSYVWTVPNILSDQWLIRVSGAADGTPSDCTSTAFRSYETVELMLSRTRMNFGAFTRETVTPTQDLFISISGESSVNWAVSHDASWLICSPASGTHSSVVTVSADVSGLAPGTYTTALVVSAENASVPYQEVQVTLHVYETDSTAPPFGYFETPLQGAVVRGSVPFTGWALDEIGIKSVKIFREEGESLVYVGDALMIEGARPDVEETYPSYPMNHKAGWGYMMLTHFLPGSGNGTFRFHAIAADFEGNQVTLGTRTISCDNANAAEPFGAIDTPENGGIASGSEYDNYGWALTPLPYTIPGDGSAITVLVDGLEVGHPVYNQYREDIAALFPGYNNSQGAMGHFFLDTTQFTNDTHTIAWVVTDDAGHSQGIGSRYFTIRDAGVSQQRFRSSSDAKNIETLNSSTGPVMVRKGYARKTVPGKVYPTNDGMIALEIQELEPIEIHLSDENPSPGSSDWHVGYLSLNTELRALPVGSFLDSRAGVYSWLPGVGQYGKFRLFFIKRKGDSEKELLKMIISIVPKSYSSK